MALRMHPSHHIPVGIWLREEIVAYHDMTVVDVADHLGVTRQTVSKLLNGRQSLSADMAIRFEKVFGVKADTLLRMQTAYELANARAQEDRIEVRALEAA